MNQSDIADLRVRLSADSAQFASAVRDAETRLRGFQTPAQNAEAITSKLGDSWKKSGSAASGALPSLQSFGSGLSGMLSTVTRLHPAMMVATAAIAAMVAGLRHGVDVLSETERSMARAEALVKATGGSAGLTAEQLDAMARSVARGTLASTQGIRDAQSVLLTFKSVTGETFSDAISLAQDMAAVMGGDAKSAAMQLGKALESPTEGINALRRSGVSFTDAQREMIKAMEDGGRIAEAQAIVLQTLREQVGGAGSAEAGGLAGAVDTLGQAWDEMWERAADRLGLARIAAGTINWLAEQLDNVSNMMAERQPFSGLDIGYLRDQRAMAEAELTLTRDRLGAIEHLTVDTRERMASGAMRREKEALLERQRVLDEQVAQLTTAIDREQKVLDVQQQSRDAAAERERQRLADKQAAEDQKAAKQAEKDAAAAAKQLEASQRAGANKLAQLDMQYASELDQLSLAHAERLARIDELQLTELEVRRRGFDSIEQLREEYRQRERAYFDELQAAHFAKLDEQIAKELEKDQEKQDRLAEQERKRIEQQERYAQQAARDYLNFTDQTISITTNMLAQAGKDQGGLMKALLAAQKLLAIPSILVAGQQAEAGAAAVAAMTGGMIGAETARNVIRAQTMMSVGIVAGTAIAGMAHSGIESIPREGTWLLDKGERVYTNNSARRIDQMYDQVMDGGAGGVTIQQHFNLMGGSDLETRLAEAAEQGATRGYQKVIEDFGSYGQGRRMLGV